MEIHEILNHSKLVDRAEKWLRSVGCSVVITEMVCQNNSGEVADAIGWRSGVSILVECKTSLADFRADQKKVFRKVPRLGMGDWRVYMSMPGVIRPESVPEGWGLLWVDGDRIKRVHGLPRSNMWCQSPFQSSKDNEVKLLVSAMRRLQ